ncbi:biotin/lipoate A/B protein ligase family protein [Paenibacillaceae bacterium WGS1546]|uniref:lipoate--protein ligase family protein n=1 Tax=Cohnella sp. WGS1546 TaxID=3366810 RepID=UPI00372CF9BB
MEPLQIQKRPREMLLLDRTGEIGPADIARAFAMDELLGRRASGGGPAICHLWRHPRAFVIGSKDGRLPGAPDAVRWLKEQDYSVLVRHSGGAAVPLDPGVVNVSLILPAESETPGAFNDDFERMFELIQATLSVYGGEVGRGEVAGSYCPGDYDLHIDGLKICGIAQRRQVGATVVQAFVNVEPSGPERARLVRSFYDRAGLGASPGDYPDVRPETMSSLQERGIRGADRAESFAAAIVSTLEAFGAKSFDEPGAFRLPGQDELDAAVRRLRERHPLR